MREEMVTRNRRQADFKRVGGYLLWEKDFPRTASLKIKRGELAVEIGAGWGGAGGGGGLLLAGQDQLFGLREKNVSAASLLGWNAGREPTLTGTFFALLT